jgi:hypothetical protein
MHYATSRKVAGSIPDEVILFIQFMGTGGSFAGVQRPGHEADHSPPSSAEVKKTFVYTSTPYAFMA